MKYSKEEYADYAKKKSPKSSLIKDTACAFIIGGIICTIGQVFFDIYQSVFKLSEDPARTATSITMIFIGALLTGLNIYHKIAKKAGGGTLVPITGFANAIVSPAMEFKKEGFILGVASKMFTVAGPVLVYGITSSVIVGFIYYIVTVL